MVESKRQLNVGCGTNLSAIVPAIASGRKTCLGAASFAIVLSIAFALAVVAVLAFSFAALVIDAAIP